MVYVTADIQDRPYAEEPRSASYNLTNPPVTRPDYDSYSYGGQFRATQLTESASLGANRIYADAYVYSFGLATVFGIIGAASFWQDDLTIESAGQTGTGTFSASVMVNGTRRGFNSAPENVGSQVAFRVDQAAGALTLSEMPANVRAQSARIRQPSC